MSLPAVFCYFPDFSENLMLTARNVPFYREIKRYVFLRTIPHINSVRVTVRKGLKGLKTKLILAGVVS